MTGPTPAALADAAAEAVRALNHATTRGAGLVHPADAYDVLGALAILAARLPQALGQVQDFSTTPPSTVASRSWTASTAATRSRP